MPTIKAAATPAGAAGAAEAAHLLRPLVLDILRERAQGLKYPLSEDDFVLCLLSFYHRAFLCDRPRRRRPKRRPKKASSRAADDQADSGGDDGDAGGPMPTEDTTICKFSWYKSVSAGWAVICWALLTGRATLSSIGRGAFLLAMEGQSDKNRQELANAGIKNSDDFNIAYDRWNRITPPC